MSDNYHYEDGAKHYDHKKVLHIDSVGSGDIEKLISAFFKDGTTFITSCRISIIPCSLNF